MIEEDLPSQVKEIILQLKEIAESDPLDGNYVLVGQNGYLQKYADSWKSSFISSGLIEPKSVSLTLKSVDVPGNIFHHLGRPELWEKPASGESGYEIESRFNQDGVEIEAFVIEEEDPTAFVTFLPRQDFVLFYSLFDRMEGSNRTWDDHMRGVSDVIKFERDEIISKIKIKKSYIFDYLFVRKKALLIGYYYDILVPAQENIPADFRKEIKYDIDNGKVSIIVAKPIFSFGKLIARLDMFKVILPPEQKILGDFGIMAEAPVVTLKTASGRVEIDKLATFRHDVGKFLSIAYFNSEVLKKYEDDKRYRIDDDGGIHYGGVWGIYRGIWRLGDEIIAAHAGDVAEGLPYEEWPHWASHNIDPLSIDENRELQKIKPIQQLLNALVSEMDSFERRHLFFMTRRIVFADEPLFRFESPQQKEEIVRELKKTFTRRTTRAEFLNRTVELYKLCVDSLNQELLTSIIDSYDPNAKFDDQRQQKGSLKLFLTYLEFQAIERLCKASGLTKKEGFSKIIEYYNCLQQPGVQNTDDFLLYEVRQRVDELRKSFRVLFALNALRSKAGGAHLGSTEEFAEAMNFLGFTETQTDFLQVYRVLITLLTQFYFQA